MAKKAKKTQQQPTGFQMVGPNDYKFTIPNTRFAGMDVQPDDPTPYGDSLDEMADSMIEVYKATGQLLLQPGGLDLDGNVRFAYTRLMTFKVKYKELCEACGVDELKIAVQYFENIDSSDALVENLRRRDQHFMSIAYTIAELRGQKHTYKVLTKKLGMSINRIKGLETLPELHPKLQQLCHDGVINERAAVVIAEATDVIQAGVAECIEANGIQKLHGKEDAERMLRNALPTVHRKTPFGAFTSLQGKEYPMITNEEWIYAEGDLMQTMYVLDERAEARRMIDYWKMIAENVKVHSGERWKITASEAYVKCEMGTHPSEIAVWSGRDQTGWLDFYVKSTELNKVNNPEAYLEERRKNLETRSNNKEVNLKAKAKLELMQQLVDQLADGEVKGTDILHIQIALLAYERFNKAQREKLDELMGKEVVASYNKNNFHEFDLGALLRNMGLAVLHGEYAVYNVHREFFDANGIDFNAVYNEKYDSELKEVIEKSRTQHRDLAIKAEDTNFDKQEFIAQMYKVIVLGTTQSLHSHLFQSNPKQDKYIKYIAKGLGMPAKGGTEIVAQRLKNVVSLLEKSFDIPFTEDEASKEKMLTELLERFNSIGMAFDERTPNATVTMDMINDEYSGMYRAYCEITGRMDLESIKLDYKPVLKAAASGEDDCNKGKMLVEQFITAYASIIKKDFGFRFVYLKNGKKVTILG